MKEVTFIRQNIEKWKRAETMVEQAESLSPDELADAYTEPVSYTHLTLPTNSLV